MKPLVGKRRGDFFYYLRRADEFLYRARELSVKAYGSHMVTAEIDRARFITSFGFSQFRSRVPGHKLMVRQILPPDTPKVKRMKAGWNCEYDG